VLLAADWVTISALATAGGTLILALATFASVRSANRAARVAERSLLVGLRPLLLPARLEDAPQKVAFMEGRYLVVPGGSATAEADEQTVLLAASLRNVGSGTGVLHGWHFYPVLVTGSAEHPALTNSPALAATSTSQPARSAFGKGAFASRSQRHSQRRAERSRSAANGQWTCSTATPKAASG